MARLIGYARVSTDEQDTAAQTDALTKAGCTAIYQDIASGADDQRPELARCLATLRKGDTLYVHRLDRLARSVHHLSGVVKDLVRRGIGFQSISDGFETESAQGRLMIHMLASVAEFERELIRERTISGMAAARARGSVPGNPGMRTGDPQAIARIRASQADTYTRRAQTEAAPWLSIVRRHRPMLTWARVLDLINATAYRDRKQLRMQTMMRHVQRLVAAGDLPASVLDRTSARDNQSAAELARRISRVAPGMSLRSIGQEMDALGVKPARADIWSAQTVARLLDNERG